MAFPAPLHLLVCEDVRFEEGGKASLLGFVGVAPHVVLGVENFQEPVELTFILLCDVIQEEGIHRVQIRIVSSDQDFVHEHEATSVKVRPRKDLRLVTDFSDVLPGPGKYQYVLSVDDEVIFREGLLLRDAKDVTMDIEESEPEPSD